MRPTFSSPAHYPLGVEGSLKFHDELRSWYTRTCDGVDTAAETDRLVKLMKADGKFFNLAKPLVPELRWTSDAPTSPSPNLNAFLDRVKPLQSQTFIPTGMLGLPRTDRAMAIHRAGEFLENLRKIKPMATGDLAATEEDREALKKYLGFTKEVEEVNTRAHTADSSQGPSPHPTSAPVEEFSRQGPEHKRIVADSSVSGHGTLLQPVRLRPSISTGQQGTTNQPLTLFKSRLPIRSKEPSSPQPSGHSASEK